MAEAIVEIWEEAPRGVAGDVRILALDGLTRMRAAVAGRMAAPPINRLIGLTPIEAHPGAATFRRILRLDATAVVMEVAARSN